VSTITLGADLGDRRLLPGGNEGSVPASEEAFLTTVKSLPAAAETQRELLVSKG
jgi:hypothetical protein